MVKHTSHKFKKITMGGKKKTKACASSHKSVNKDSVEGNSEVVAEKANDNDKLEPAKVVDQEKLMALEVANDKLAKLVGEQSTKLRNNDEKMVALENKLEKLHQQNQIKINELSSSVEDCNYRNTLLTENLKVLTGKLAVLTAECSDKDDIIYHQQNEILEKENVIEVLSSSLEQAKHRAEKEREESFRKMAELLTSNSIKYAQEKLCNEMAVAEHTKKNEELYKKLSTEKNITTLLEDSLLDSQVDLKKLHQEADEEKSKLANEMKMLQESNKHMLATMADLQQKVAELKNQKKEIQNAKFDEIELMTKNHQQMVSQLKFEQENELMAFQAETENAMNDLKRSHQMKISLFEQQDRQLVKNIQAKHEEIIDALANKKRWCFIKKKVKVDKVITNLQNICYYIDGEISLQ